MIEFVNYDPVKNDPNKPLKTINEIIEVIESYGLIRSEIGLSDEELSRRSYSSLHSLCQKSAEEKERYLASKCLIDTVATTEENDLDENYGRIRNAFLKVDPQNESGTLYDVLTRAPNLYNSLCMLSNTDILKVARQMVYIDTHSDKIDGVTQIFNKNPTLYIRRALRGKLGMYNSLRQIDSNTLIPFWVEGQPPDIYVHSDEALPSDYPFYFNDIPDNEEQSAPVESAKQKPVSIRSIGKVLEPQLEIKEIIEMFLESRILVTNSSHGKLINELRYCTPKQINALISNLLRARTEGEIEDLSRYLLENKDKMINNLNVKEVSESIELTKTT